MLDKKITKDDSDAKTTIDQSPFHATVPNQIHAEPEKASVNEKPIDELDSDGSGSAFERTEEVRE